ncbi:MAG TPA: twin-arginine translocase TatA/TatE family subunit [Coriobacteriia bacterium]|nr:twin-arginine translocase TatA/TatE family subunit [Coriobacteriia bacterium]
MAFVPGIPGGWEWVIILVVVLLLFGPSRLPQLGKSIGKTVRAIRDGVDGKGQDEEEEDEAKSAKPDAPSDEAKPSKSDKTSE